MAMIEIQFYINYSNNNYLWVITQTYLKYVLKLAVGTEGHRARADTQLSPHQAGQASPKE